MGEFLPWEVSATEIDEELKLKILALSCSDKTFYGPFDNNNTNTDDLTNKSETEETSATFDLDSHVSLIRKLLTIDSNLADAHARLSGSKIKEHVFWHNYFYHCLKTQIDHRSNDNPTTNQKQQSTTQSNDNNLKKEKEAETTKSIIQKSSSPDNDDDDIVNIPSPPRSARSIGDLVVVGSSYATDDSVDVQNIFIDKNKK